MDFVDNNIQKVQVQPEDQVYARNEDIKVYGKLVSMSTENVVADSEQIWDETLKKNQSDVNSWVQQEFERYLPLTGGRIDENLDIDGNLNVYGEVGAGTLLTLGDSLRIKEGSFVFEGADNESLFINYNGLTYAFTENQSQGFNVKEGDAHLNSITVIPKENNDTDRSVSYVGPGMISVNDGNNTALFTPTSIELGFEDSNDQTHISADKILTKKISMADAKPLITHNLFITPGSIEMNQGGTKRHQTTIRPSGIITNGSIRLENGTNDDILLADGSIIKLSQPNGVAKLDQDGNIPLENLGNLDTQIALVVNQLPTTDIKTNKIYLVRKNETGQDNAYIEYVYINNSWEKFGEYTPSIDLSEYSLKSQTVSSAAFVANSGNTQLQLTNANGSKSSVYVPIAETPGASSSGQLTSGQNGFMSVSDKVKLNGIEESANNYILKKATASDLGGIKIGFTVNSSSKNYPVTLDSNDEAYVHVPWTDTQTDISNCVKNNEDGIINGDLTVNGNLSTSDADIVINSGKLELHSASDGIKFVDNEDSVYISIANGSANEYFATDGSIQTIPNSYLPLSGGTVTGGITVDGAINTKSNITTDGTVTAKGFVSKTEKNSPHEVWACNGGSINLKTIIAAIAVYVHGSIVKSIAGSINQVTTIDDPDAIIFNKATGSFVAEKGNKYYKYWTTVDNLLISDSDKYGIFTAGKGTVPYHNQLYRFANDNSNIYIANNAGSVPILDIYKLI